MESDKDRRSALDPYADLKGYFPEEYDLSPDELEKSIQNETKMRSIALDMTDAARGRTAPGQDTDEKAEIADAAELSQTHGAAHKPDGTYDTERGHKADTDGAAFAAAEYIEKNAADIPSPIDGDAAAEIEEADDGIAVGDDALRLSADGNYDSDTAEAADTVTDGTEDLSADGTPFGIPVGEDVSSNELLNKYPPLDDLLSELESDGNAENTSAAPAEESDDKSSLRRSVNWLFDFLEVFSICMACIILTFTFVARLTKVDGHSMDDTLNDGQYLVVSNLFYTPKVGDIVVLQNTSLDYTPLREPLVKRIIAIGGQTVDIALDGTVTITEADGSSHVLEQTFIKNESYNGAPTHCEVPEGYVFVMGDNRNGSTDSRDYRVGIVDERCVFGHALFRILPFNEMTVFHNPYDGGSAS